MSWVKLDDQFTDHPKVIAAGPMAGWLYVCGLTYCSRYLTDGFIPTAQVRRLADLKGTDRLASALVDAGLWDRCDGGYMVHDYLEYNPNAEKVRAERSAAQDRMFRRRSAELRPNVERTSPEVQRPRPVPVSSKELRDEEPTAPAPAARPARPPTPVPKPKPPPKTTAEDGPAYALVDAYARAKGLVPTDIQGRQRTEAVALFRGLAGDVGAEDVVGCTGYLLADPFWSGPGKLTPRKVAETVREWRAMGRPDVPPPRTTNGNGSKPYGKDIGYTTEQLVAMARGKQ